MEAADIIAKFKANYNGCTRYADRGVASVGPLLPFRIYFKTEYEAACDLKFSFKSFFPFPSVGGLKCNKTRSWVTYLGHAESVPTVEHAIGALTGVSCLSSYIVPSLLAKLNLNTDWNALKLAGSETYRGRDCFVLAGDNQECSDEFWIDCERFELRRYRSLSRSLLKCIPGGLPVRHSKRFVAVMNSLARSVEYHDVQMHSSARQGSPNSYETSA